MTDDRLPSFGKLHALNWTIWKCNWPGSCGHCLELKRSLCKLLLNRQKSLKLSLDLLFWFWSRSLLFVTQSVTTPQQAWDELVGQFEQPLSFLESGVPMMESLQTVSVVFR